MKISIIIATYNAAMTIEQCLLSIIHQMNESCELIIIDGESNDATIDILQKYRDNINYLISESDGGIYDAWNKGVKIAKGQWIMFLGADDELMPNAIKNYYSVIDNIKDTEKIDYICSKDDLIGVDGRSLRKIGQEPSWSRMKYNMAAAHVASLHSKKNLFEEIGLYDLQFPICADYELLLRKKDRLKFLFLPSFTMAKMREGGVSSTWKAVFETYKIRKYHETISPILNILELIKSLLCYKFYKYHG